MQISGKTFVVTGAASGLGLSTCQLLLKEGANVLGLDCNKNFDFEHRMGDKFLYAAVDVLDSDGLKAALKNATKKWQTIHGLINCAGIAPAQKLLSRELEPIPLEDFKRVIDINLTGTLNVTRLVCAIMAKNSQEADAIDGGVVINTASVAAFEGQIGQIAYSASKGAVAAFTLPLARELARHKIRVMAIAPGIFETPMLKGLPEKAQQSLATQVPFPARLGRADEFAKLCLHIIQNDYLNGEVIRLDGAIRMGAI